MALQLHKGHLEVQFPDIVNLAAVNMLVGKILQHVAKRANPQLLVENQLSLRTHALQIFYVLFKYVVHSPCKILMG